MKTIKIAHEAPKSIFRKIQCFTDYDYALVHLFEEDEEYFNLFKEALKNGREVVLDNSVFELGKAFNPERFVYWINKLQPTYYIVPDVLESFDGTRKNMLDWKENWPSKVISGPKMIGVVQGNSYEAIKRCYTFMVEDAQVDKVAISFDYSYYEQSVPHPNRLMSWVLGRVKLLGDLMQDGTLRTDVPHHLLGCALPCEGIFYPSKYYDFIESMDTSNPVVHGLREIEYRGPLGLTTKESTKLYTLINSEVSDEQEYSIIGNCLRFRTMWCGNYGN